MLMMSVIMLSRTILSITLLVMVLSVVMLNVVAPLVFIIYVSTIVYLSITPIRYKVGRGFMVENLFGRQAYDRHTVQ
jgi:hypothetical protein